MRDTIGQQARTGASVLGGIAGVKDGHPRVRPLPAAHREGGPVTQHRARSGPCGPRQGLFQKLRWHRSSTLACRNPDIPHLCSGTPPVKEKANRTAPRGNMKVPRPRGVTSLEPAWEQTEGPATTAVCTFAWRCVNGAAYLSRFLERSSTCSGSVVVTTGGPMNPGRPGAGLARPSTSSGLARAAPPSEAYSPVTTMLSRWMTSSGPVCPRIPATLLLCSRLMRRISAAE